MFCKKLLYLFCMAITPLATYSAARKPAEDLPFATHSDAAASKPTVYLLEDLPIKVWVRYVAECLDGRLVSNATQLELKQSQLGNLRSIGMSLHMQLKKDLKMPLLEISYPYFIYPLSRDNRIGSTPQCVWENKEISSRKKTPFARAEDVERAEIAGIKNGERFIFLGMKERIEE